MRAGRSKASWVGGDASDSVTSEDIRHDPRGRIQLEIYDKSGKKGRSPAGSNAALRVTRRHSLVQDLAIC